MNKYIVGAVAGATSLAIVFPVVVQFASAAESDSLRADRPAPSQECVKAHIDKDSVFLSSIDAMIAAHKSAVFTHKNALTVAATITDGAARKAAVDAANDAFHIAIKAVKDSQSAAHAAEREVITTACGDARFGMRGARAGLDGMPRMKGGKGFHMNQGGFGRGQSIRSNSQEQ